MTCSATRRWARTNPNPNRDPDPNPNLNPDPDPDPDPNQVGALRAPAAAFLRVPTESVDVRFAHDAAPLDDAATAEEVGLFSRRRECRVSIRQVRVVFHGMPPAGARYGAVSTVAAHGIRDSCES
jgi:hypothetical protein